MYPGWGRYADKQEGRALGHMLKRIIVDDKRMFDTKVDKLVKHYKWTREVNNAIIPNGGDYD